MQSNESPPSPAGIQVAYCAEQFENDGSPVSTIVKGVKRAMAGEYSRELSAKVFAGQCRLIELGFRQGEPEGYGPNRALIDQSGSVKGQLSRGEHKSLQTDRVDYYLLPRLDYVKGILLLLKNGEERLLVAVEGGRVPLNVAITIAGAGSDEAMQAALQDAYESGKLRGGQLMQVRRVLQRRSTLGKSIAHRPARKGVSVTTSSLVRNYRHEVERQKLMVKKAAVG
jgi:hypothetical protein